MSYKQYLALLLAIITSVNFIMIPFITGSLLSVIVALTFSIILQYLFYKLKDNIDINNAVLKVLISIRFLFLSALLLDLFSKISHDVFLRDTSIYIILIFTFIAAMYCSINNAIFTVSRLLFIFILIPVISVIIFSLFDIKTNNIYYNYHKWNFIDIFTVIFVSMMVDVPIISASYLNKKIAANKLIIPSILSSVIIFLICFCIIGRFGDGAYNYNYPSFELMFSANIPGYIVKRQEGVLIPLFLSGLLIAISYFTRLSFYSKKKAFNSIAILILSIAILYFDNIIDFYIIISFFTGIILVFAMFIIGGVKK